MKIEEKMSTLIRIVLNSTSVKTISKCGLRKFNKSSFQVMDQNDFSSVSKKLKIAFKISRYPISLFGLVSILIVALVIVKNENNELFKDYKQ